MKITVVRHAKVQAPTRWVSGWSLAEWLDAYEAAPLMHAKEWPKFSAACAVSSPVRRARESAIGCGYVAPICLDELAEIALPRELPLPFFGPGKLAAVLVRALWLVGDIEAAETPSEVEERAGRAADALVKLSEDHEEVVVFTHGYFMRFLDCELRARGWRRERRLSWSYLASNVYTGPRRNG